MGGHQRAPPLCTSTLRPLPDLVPAPHLCVNDLHPGSVGDGQHPRVGGEVCPAPGRGVSEHQRLRVLVHLPQAGEMEPGPWRVGLCEGLWAGVYPILRESGARPIGHGARGGSGEGHTHPGGSTDRRFLIGCRQLVPGAGEGCGIGGQAEPLPAPRRPLPAQETTDPSPEADPGGALCNLQHLDSGRSPPPVHLPQGAVVVGADSQQSWEDAEGQGGVAGWWGVGVGRGLGTYILPGRCGSPPAGQARGGGCG